MLWLDIVQEKQGVTQNKHETKKKKNKKTVLLPFYSRDLTIFKFLKK